MRHFALVGNPNSGKTTLFNSLTGSTAHVGNWPGVTVDKKEGLYKKEKEPISIVDLPGIYSLSPYTPEEVISRNFIIDTRPDCIINIVDATNLERNLYLTTQILEIDVPIVIALNMMDALKKNGDTIDIKKLEQKLGVRIVEISALKQENLEDLMKVCYEECQKTRIGKSVLIGTDLTHLIKDVEFEFKKANVDNPLFHAIKFVENDELEVKNHPELCKIVDNYKKTFHDEAFGNDFEAIVADSRYRYITKYLIDALVKHQNNNTKSSSKSDKLDKVLTNKWAGIPLFILIIFVLFHITFSDDLFFLHSFNLIDYTTFDGTMWSGLFMDGGIASIGVFLQRFLTIIFDAFKGVVRVGLGTSTWYSGLISDGILGGVFTLLSFLPQIMLLFLFFSILEDSGYMARVAFMLDRIFRKFGLSGRAIIPMIMGFGCSVPAMINTRTLADDKERIMTIRVIPFFSCGAKLPMLTAVSGALVVALGVPNADLVTLGMYFLGIIVALLAILLMRTTVYKGNSSPFIMELPSYHVPQFQALMLHLWDKVKHFIKKAFTIILASSIIIWVISHFTWDWQYINDANIELLSNSILASLGKFLQPLFTPLGFGVQIGSFGWIFVVSCISGIIAKENIIATIGTMSAIVGGISGASGSEAVISMITATGIAIPGLLAFIAFNMLTIPCAASIATAKAELPKDKFITTLIFWVVISYVVASIIYLSGTYVWSIGIIIPLFILFILGIYLFNKFYKGKTINIKKENE